MIHFFGELYRSVSQVLIHHTLQRLLLSYIKAP